MAVATVLSTQIFMDEYRFTTNANMTHIATNVVMKNSTTFVSGGYDTFVPGLKNLVCDLGGFNDYAAGGLDEWMRSNYGTTQTVTVVPLGETLGNAAVITQGILETDPSFDGSVGDIPAVKLSVKPVGQVIAQGQVTNITSPTITVTGNTTPVQVGAITATQQMRAAVHVLAISGTATPTLTCQLASSATSGGAYTTRGPAGAGITVIGGQFLATGLIGAITDTWWRLNYTVTGTSPIFTVFASIAPS